MQVFSLNKKILIGTYTSYLVDAFKRMTLYLKIKLYVLIRNVKRHCTDRRKIVIIPWQENTCSCKELNAIYHYSLFLMHTKIRSSVQAHRWYLYSHAYINNPNQNRTTAKTIYYIIIVICLTLSLLLYVTKKKTSSFPYLYLVLASK